MKKLLLTSSLLVLVLFPKFGISQGLLGGEIRWDCIPAGQVNIGKFVFYLKVYQACYNDTGANPVLASSQIMHTTSPAGNRSMNLLPGYPMDVSPICSPDTSLTHNSCSSPDSISAFNGAHRLYIYVDTFAINGLPPAQGWMFSWSGGRRNRSSNLIDTLNPTMRLRSIMYSYANLNTYPCFDNAPSSAEAPIVMTCNGYDFNYYSATTDQELDSLMFYWEHLIDTNGTSVSFNANRAYSNPLPDTSDNSNNTPAIIYPYTGKLSITTYTEGGFFANQKIAAFKCGVKVAEIYRDMYFQFYDCGTNVSPVFQAPFKNGTSFVDSVYACTRVSFNLNFVDSQFLYSNIPQSVKMMAYGSLFGSYIPANGSNPPVFDTTSGCINPPCATLNAAPSKLLPLQDTTILNTHFTWQTDCGHLATNAGCGVTINSYSYYFKYWDDYCPVPAYNFGSFTIVVMPYPNLPPPIMDSLVVDSTSGDIALYWQPVIDSFNIFNSYRVYSANNANGPYSIIDSLSNLSDSVYIDSNANGLSQAKYYYLRTTFQNTPYSLNWSFPSDTLHNNYIPPPPTPITDLEVQKIWDPYLVPKMHVWAMVKNIGNQLIDTIDISYYQPDSTWVIEQWVGQLLAGDSITFKFTQKFIPSSNPNYQLCVKAAVSGDADTLNNKACIQTHLGISVIETPQFQLLPNIPNPANESTQIRFLLPKNGAVQLRVFDISGRQLIQEQIDAHKGTNSYKIDLSGFDNGVFFYQLRYNSINLNAKFVVLR